MSARHPLEEEDDFYAQLEQAAAEADTAVPGAHSTHGAQRAAYDGSIASLRDLMDQGSWRDLAEATREGAAALSVDAHHAGGAASIPPLTAAAFHATALSRLQQWDLVAQLLRDVDTSSAEAPFALRWLAAELPARSCDPAAAIAGHCRLLNECVRHVPAAPADDVDLSELSGGVADDRAGDDFEVHPSPGDGAAWARRAASCAAALAAHHARSQEWATALRWMQWLLQRRPADPHLLSQTGYLMLSMGDIAGAEAMFERAALRPQAGKALVHSNAGLVRFTQRDLDGALTDFEAAAAAEPSDAAAANNIAVCELFNTQAHAAVQGLQTAVRERPRDLLTDGCAATLSRLYELGPPVGVATAKRRLAEFAASAGPEGMHAVSLEV